MHRGDRARRPRPDHVRGSTADAFPEAFDGRPIVEALGASAETPLEEGVRRTMDCYRAALRDGTLDDAYLDRVLA